MPSSTPSPRRPTSAPNTHNEPFRADSDSVKHGAYELGRTIARGGMGVVFEAKHRELGRIVALKVVRGANLASSAEIGRFRAETEAAARLDHPNIVPIYDIGELHGQPYFTMKLIDGGSLANRLKSGAMPVREAVATMAKVARAVEHAHMRGVLHRDLKPGNILLDSDGEPFLTDFGLAKFTNADTSLTMTGEVVGTPEYMSPEQTRGEELTTACDVWALGVLLYQMLSGRVPYTGTNAMEIIRDIADNEPPPLSIGTTSASAVVKKGRDCIDRDISTIVGRCLEKDTSRRMPSAGFLAKELESWIAGEPIRSRHITQTERIAKWARRHPGTVTAVGLILASILAGSVTSFVLWRKAVAAKTQTEFANEKLTAAIGQSELQRVGLQSANERLDRALRHATATRLATDARVALDTNVSLGLSLAIESAESMQSVGESPIAESVSTLMHSLILVGGEDFSAGRGFVDQSGAFTTHVAGFALRPEMGSKPLTSPDGRWVVTSDFTEGGFFVALFKEGLPLNGEPIKRFSLYGTKQVDPGAFAYAWSPDSRELIICDTTSDEVRAWDVLADVGHASRAANDFSPPPYRVLATNSEGNAGVTIMGDSKGSPVAVVRGHIRKTGVALFWQPFEHRTDSNGNSLPVTLKSSIADPIPREQQNANPAAFIASKSGRWLLAYDSFRSTAPRLLHVDNPDVFPASIVLEPIPQYLTIASFSTDERWLAVSSSARIVQLFDLSSPPDGRTSCMIPAHVLEGDQAVFSPDGKWLVLASANSVIKAFPMDNTGPRMNDGFAYRIGGETIRQISFQPGSDNLAIAGSDSVVRMVSISGMRNGVPPAEYRGMNSDAFRVIFSKDGKILTALGRTGETRRWEIKGFTVGRMPDVFPNETGPPYYNGRVAGRALDRDNHRKRKSRTETCGAV